MFIKHIKKTRLLVEIELLFELSNRYPPPSTRREIPYLLTPIYTSRFLHQSVFHARSRVW